MFGRIITLLSVLAACASNACWQAISLQDFVKQSQVIVVGQIQRVTTAPKSHYSDDIGFIKVERVLKNTAKGQSIKVGAEIPLSMPSVNNETHLSTDLYYTKGQRGVWILYFAEGKFHASHPMSLQPISEEKKVTAAMLPAKQTKTKQAAGTKTKK